MNLIERLAPEMIVLIERRYNILRTIFHHQPIGRRLLAEKLALGERLVRSEIDLLREQNLLRTESLGVSLTGECQALMADLGELVHKLRGLASLEAFLADEMDLDKVLIVPGDVDSEQDVQAEMGKLGAWYLKNTVQDQWVVAVTGGTTMAQVAKHTSAAPGKSNVLLVPARGGLGEDVKIQANTIVARIASQWSAAYRLLHVPDTLKESALESLMADHRVGEVVNLSKNAHLLVHGIGVPQVMAARREKKWESIVRKSVREPVGEAFGNYFAADGSVVLATPTIGPKLEDLTKIELVVAVAGGHSKAQAILAVLRAGFVKVLITDQGAAQRMRQILEEK